MDKLKADAGGGMSAAGVAGTPAPQQDEFQRLFGLAHAWAQECYFRGLGRPFDIDAKRGEFAVALRLALPAAGVMGTPGGQSNG